MSRLAYHIAAVYRVRSYIIVGTFVAVLAALWTAWQGNKFAITLDRDKAVSFHHTALVILDFYLPILAAIGASVFQGHGAGAAALNTTRQEARVANLYSILLFSVVLGAPPVAYFCGDAKDVNNWLVGSAALLSSLLVTGVGYYFGVGKKGAGKKTMALGEGFQAKSKGSSKKGAQK